MNDFDPYYMVPPAVIGALVAIWRAYRKIKIEAQEDDRVQSIDTRQENLMQHMQDEIDRLIKRLDDTAKSKDSISDLYASTMAENARLSERVTTLEKENAALKKRLDELDEELRKLKAKGQ